MPLSRLNKHLALHLGISRRAADEIISRGEVIVEGQPALLGQRISSTDSITVRGELLPAEAPRLYLILNKPAGYVSSRRRQGDSPTLYELLPDAYHALKPVGRLDRDSSGLILLSNDGDFAHRMTHPSFHKTKVYRVRLDRPLEPLHQQMISDFGVTLDDGTSKFLLERLNDTRTEWAITMTEGRNRQIRRTFAALGYTVTKLHRTTFGHYALGDIKRGEYSVVDMR